MPVVEQLAIGPHAWAVLSLTVLALFLFTRKQIPLDRMFSTSATEQGQAIASGELIIATGGNGLLWELIGMEDTSGFEWTWQTPKEGAMTWHCGLCIHPAALENGMYEKCHALIDPS